MEVICFIFPCVLWRKAGSSTGKLSEGENSRRRAPAATGSHLGTSPSCRTVRECGVERKQGKCLSVSKCRVLCTEYSRPSETHFVPLSKCVHVRDALDAQFSRSFLRAHSRQKIRRSGSSIQVSPRFELIIIQRRGIVFALTYADRSRVLAKKFIKCS